MTSPILSRTGMQPDAVRNFGKAPVRVAHRLHERAMFGDAALADVLDRYPRDHLGVFTMGEDEEDWRSWQRGKPGDLSGAEMLDAVRTGRIWLNLRDTNAFLPEYADLAADMFGALQREVPGLHTFKRDVGLLISSPGAQVFYHLDVPRVALWHVRGRKRVWLYPVEPPYVDEKTLERIVLKESAEQFEYHREMDAGAAVFDLEPGDMVHWPQNAPHRIVNGDSVNVSLSTEFLSPGALVRANAVWANGFLRRRFGLNPSLQGDWHPASLAKFALARSAKAMGLQATPPEPLAPSFQIDPGSPACVRSLA